MSYPLNYSLMQGPFDIRRYGAWCNGKMVVDASCNIPSSGSSAITLTAASATVYTGGGSVVSNCEILGTGRGYVVNAGGDTRIIDNNIYGGSNGNPVIYTDSNDCVIRDNHIYQGTTAPCNGAVLVDLAVTANGATQVSGNVFDTTNSPGVVVSCRNSGVVAKGVQISSNTMYTSAGTTNATYSFLNLTGDASGANLQGLNVQGNTIRGNQATPFTSGTLQYLVDSTALASTTLTGCYIGGNVMTDAAGNGTNFVYSSGDTTPPAGITSVSNVVTDTSGTVHIH